MNTPDDSIELLKSNLHALARRADNANTLAALLAARLAEQRREIEALRTWLAPADTPPPPAFEDQPPSIVSPYD
jgi:hypothetical protein